MEAVKDSSGNWTCRAYYKDAEGKIRRPRFTRKRKTEALQAAIACMAEHKDDYRLAKQGRAFITFQEAAERYIRNRSKVLSPPTITGYYSILDNSFAQVSDRNVYDLIDEDLQILVNTWVEEGKTPKTVRNRYGFLSAVLKSCRPSFTPSVTLPQRVKPQLYTPTDAEIEILLRAVKNTRMEFPVMFAAMGSMRRSEICALIAEDIGEGWIRVNKALVLNGNGRWVIKTTKTESGTRTTYVPKELTDRIHAAVQEGPVVTMNPTMISEAFPRLLEHLGLPKFRFHDLRSYYASVMHFLGVPDLYIMQYGGWHDRQTLQEHYQRTMPDKVPEMAAKGVQHFKELLPSK